MSTEKETLRTNLEKLAEKPDTTRNDLRSVLRPLYEEHQKHERLVESCPFCEGVIT